MNLPAAVKQSLEPTSQVLRILEDYLEELEGGRQPNPDELVARHPELAEPLRACLASLEFLHGAALSLRGGPAPVSAAVVPTLGRLGDFRIRREVGRGGMGVVYEAEQISLGRRVALKVLPMEAARDAKLLARFRRESRAAAQLHHSNIVPVFEVGQEGDVFFYAMQYIQGQPLDVVIKELQQLRAASEGTPSTDVAPAASVVARSLLTGQFEPARSGDATIDSKPEPGDEPQPTVGPVADPPAPAALPGQSELSMVALDYPLYCRHVARIGLQVAEALAYAHARGIIHRDIKPANLLLDTTGVLWVSDFGLAKTQDPALTDTGDLVGTLRYMAPERFRGECDARADVYALGLTLYELLVLRPAFDGKDRLHLVEQIGRQEPARLRTLDPRIPRDLETILMKAIEKDPRRRYPSADDLAEDLRRYLADEPIRARRIGPLERLGRWGRRNPLVASLSAAVVLVTALGFAGVFGQMQVALANEQQASANAAKAQKNEQEAKKQRDDAQRQRDEVQALNAKLQATQAQLRSTLYTAHMNLAQRAWEEAAIPRVLELLDQHRPKSGEPDLRHFEWHYLHRLCHSELVTLKGHTGYVAFVSFSPDGKRLASASHDNTVKLWDAQTGKELLTFKGHTGRVNSVAFSPDGKHLASSGGGGTKVWEAQTGQELLSLKDGGSGVAFSPDGKRLASGSLDNTVKVWDAQTGQELLSLKGHTASANGVAFSPDGKRLASASYRGIVKVWDAQTGQELLSLKGTVYCVAFSPDGQRLASGDIGKVGEVKVWDAQTGQELLTLKGPPAWIDIVSFSPDGKRLASGSWLGILQIWDLQTGQELRTFKGGGGSVAFSPDGQRLASNAADKTVKVWDAHKDQENLTLPRDSEGNVAFSSDGRRLASASRDNTVKVWDAQTGQLTLTLKGHTVPVWRVAFSPDGKRLASSGPRSRPGVRTEVKVWDAETGQERLSLQDLKGSIESLAFSPDGKRLASASGGGAKVWDAQTGQELLSLKGQVRYPPSVVFSPDGKRLASATFDETVKVWDAQTGQELLSLKAHTGSFSSMAFSPDGLRLASGNRGTGEVKVWDAQTGQELLSLKGGSWVVFSPDGHRLASSGGDGPVKIWDATPLPAKP